MDIILENITKKYFKEWIFRNINYHFLDRESYAVIGANGSGKSTLLQVVSALLPATSGNISYKINQQIIEHTDVYKHISIVAPYQSIIEEFTLEEIYKFHFSFKPLADSNMTFPHWLDILQLTASKNKTIAHFSSGMKQRVKLGLVFYAQQDLILLDEPTTNLDTQGIVWYQQEIEKLRNKTTLIICSNQAEEYQFCNYRLNIQDWKKP